MGNGESKMIIGAPGGGGQTIIRKEGLREELTLPVQQWQALMVVRLLLAVAILGLIWLWSPWSVILAVPILVALGLVRLLRYISQERLDNLAPAARYGLPVVGLSLLVAWLVYLGRLAVEAVWPASLGIGSLIVPLRFVWHWRAIVRFLLSVPPGVYIWTYRSLAYRLVCEIADPNWPPPVKERLPDTGPALPGADLRSEQPAPPSKEMIEEMRKVLRAEAQTLKIEISHQEQSGRRWLEYVHLPASDEQMARLAKLVLAGTPISERELAGGDLPLSGRDQFNAVRDELLERGAIHWRKPGTPQQGLELTTFGRVMLQRLAANGNGHPPTPSGLEVVRE